MSSFFNGWEVKACSGVVRPAARAALSPPNKKMHATPNQTIGIEDRSTRGMTSSKIFLALNTKGNNGTKLIPDNNVPHIAPKMATTNS